MSLKGVGDLLVTKAGWPRGIITERDFVRRVIARRRSLDTKVSDVMSKPLITIGPNASINTAARKMVQNRIRRLPLTEKHKLVGIIVASDLARHLSKKTFSESVHEAIWRYPVT